jgi:hypothetical protein
LCFHRSPFDSYKYVLIFLYRVANIRGHLAAAIPLSDQILLLGPPYKVPKDSTLQSDEILHSLRLGDAEDDPISEERIPQQQQQQQQQPNQQLSNQSAEVTDESPDAISETKHIPAKLLHTPSERSGARRLFLFSKQGETTNR